MTDITTSNTELDQFITVKKFPRGHIRSIIGVAYIEEPIEHVNYLITCAHDSVKVWQIDTDNADILIEKQEIKGWRSGAQDFDVTPDGRLIVVVGVDSLLHCITLSLEESKFTLNSFNIGYMEAWKVAISPDVGAEPSGTRFLTLSFSGFLTVLDGTGRVVESVPYNAVRQVSSLIYSPDGKLVALGSNEGVVSILNAENLSIRFFFEAHALKLRTLCFSNKSDHLLTGADDKIIKLYSLNGGKEKFIRSFCSHRSCVNAVKFHPYDPKRFASCSNDGCVILWSVSEDRPLHIFQNVHDGVARNVSFSLNGQFIASVGEDRAICIHRIRKQEMLTDEEVGRIQGTSHSDIAYKNGVVEDDIKEMDYNFQEDSVSAESAQNAYNFGGFDDDLDEVDELMARARRDLEDINSG